MLTEWTLTLDFYAHHVLAVPSRTIVKCILDTIFPLATTRAVRCSWDLLFLPCRRRGSQPRARGSGPWRTHLCLLKGQAAGLQDRAGTLQQQLGSLVLSAMARGRRSSPLTLGYLYADTLSWSWDHCFPKSCSSTQQSSLQPVLAFTLFHHLLSLAAKYRP